MLCYTIKTFEYNLPPQKQCLILMTHFNFYTSRRGIIYSSIGNVVGGMP